MRQAHVKNTRFEGHVQVRLNQEGRWMRHRGIPEFGLVVNDLNALASFALVGFDHHGKATLASSNLTSTHSTRFGRKDSDGFVRCRQSIEGLLFVGAVEPSHRHPRVDVCVEEETSHGWPKTGNAQAPGGTRSKWAKIQCVRRIQKRRLMAISIVPPIPLASGDPGNAFQWVHHACVS